MAYARHRTQRVGARPQVRHLAEVLERRALRLNGIRVGIVHPPDDVNGVGLYRGILLGFARLVGWIDRYIVDGLLNVFSAWTLRAGDALRRIQSGKAQDYVYGVAFGFLALIIWSQFWR